MSENKPIAEMQDFPYRVFYAAKKAIKAHASGGSILIIATVLAMIIANLPATREYYSHFWTQEISLKIGDFNLFSHGGVPMNLLEFINDALMTIFFFSIGLEIKREILVGELSSFRQALLPIIAAIGGMIVPVAIFMYFSQGTDYANGAAIPMATDIAFSLGVLAMLGKRVPISLKIFLTTLAVVDDIGGIIVIATCYSTHIEWIMLIYAVALLAILILASFFRMQSKILYLLIGGGVWYCFLNSGIHATIAGVLVAFCIPATPVYPPKKYVGIIRKAISHFNAEDDDKLSQKKILTNEQVDYLKEIESASDKVISPLQDLEDSLHPFVNYFIIPLFAFANAGIYLLDIEPATIFEGISLAIICGLFFGKFIGIFLFTWTTIKLKLAPKPACSNWKMIASVAMLGGIGFTVSIFIATLSFTGNDNHSMELLNNAKLGIVIGSLISGIFGFILLKLFLPKNATDDCDE